MLIAAAYSAANRGHKTQVLIQSLRNDAVQVLGPMGAIHTQCATDNRR
jgi:hypothetical protein